MFNFITDIKNEIAKLAAAVEARFDALEAKFTTKADAVVADVKTEVTTVEDKAVVAATPAVVVEAVAATEQTPNAA